jgi:hypothetical protein
MSDNAITAPSMPPEIAKAVIAVMREVKKLGKEGNNTFQRYKFTSVDQFYEALGPLMASHGLFDVAIERSSAVDVREVADDKGNIKKSAWLAVDVDFWLYHESGSSYGPIPRHIQVQATGAQSYASAQSYVEKYFLRNLFKVPTGDVDEIDTSQQAGLPAPPSTIFITPEQVEELDEILVSLNEKVQEGFKKYFGVEFLGRLPASEYDFALKSLKAKKRKQDSLHNQMMAIEATEPAQ